MKLKDALPEASRATSRIPVGVRILTVTLGLPPDTETVTTSPGSTLVEPQGLSTLRQAVQVAWTIQGSHPAS